MTTNPLASGTPPEGWDALVRAMRVVRRPLDRFLHVEASSGIVLLVTAVLALAWANSPWAELYDRLWHTPVGLHFGGVNVTRDLHWLVNDGLMVIFFFVVGLEIRRELHKGELSHWRRAALPVAAALGGMIAPAALYLLFAHDPTTRSGWGVPMATDIAFAVGVLTLMGKGMPSGLRAMLLALAVIDDLGSILVIAFFYSSPGSVGGMVVALLGFCAILLMQRFGVRAPLAYVPPAVAAWAGVYVMGVHPTIAGVIVGLLTPVRSWLGPREVALGVRSEMRDMQADVPTREIARRVRHVNVLGREAISPADSLIERLHPWVAFVIMPLFALANAGVAIRDVELDGTSARLVLGITIGLVLGKPLGIVAASALALRMKIAALPTGLGTRHLVVLGVVGGIGFTMSLFIAELAFAESPLLSAAKVGVLVGSSCAGLAAFVLGRKASHVKTICAPSARS